MDKRRILRLSLQAVLAVAVINAAIYFLRSPQTQVLAAQKDFFKAVEERDWDEVKEFLAENYTDAYSHTRETAVEDAKKYLGGFYTLTLMREETTVRAAKGQGMVSAKIRIEGNGAGYSQFVVTYANQLTEPWIFHWHNPGRWPWGWRLNMIHNDQVR
jgi:uncharacterized membrane protein YvbJ